MNLGEGLIIDTERLFKHIPKKIRSIVILCKNDTGKYVTFIARNDIATFPCPCKGVKESFFKDCMDEIDDADI